MNEPSAAAVLESMALLATLSTAHEVGQAVAARRAGRDPAAQEPSDVAAPALREAARELNDVLMQLLLGRMHVRHHAEDDLAAAVRHFDLLLKLRRAARLVHAIHQRLLSLYPDVSPELVEEARHAEAELGRLLDADPETVAPKVFADTLDAFIERALGLVTWTQYEV
jgi:hypothetical protein